MQMAKDAERNLSDRALRDLLEDGVARFVEELRQQARQPIGRDQPDRNGHQGS